MCGSADITCTAQAREEFVGAAFNVGAADSDEQAGWEGGRKGWREEEWMGQYYLIRNMEDPSRQNRHLPSDTFSLSPSLSPSLLTFHCHKLPQHGTKHDAGKADNSTYPSHTPSLPTFLPSSLPPSLLLTSHRHKLPQQGTERDAGKVNDGTANEDADPRSVVNGAALEREGREGRRGRRAGHK